MSSQINRGALYQDLFASIKKSNSDLAMQVIQKKANDIVWADIKKESVTDKELEKKTMARVEVELQKATKKKSTFLNFFNKPRSTPISHSIEGAQADFPVKREDVQAPENQENQDPIDTLNSRDSSKPAQAASRERIVCLSKKLTSLRAAKDAIASPEIEKMIDDAQKKLNSEHPKLKKSGKNALYQKNIVL